MTGQQIRFDDGASYERMMGVWSRIAGETFLDWLKPAPELRWVDIGCGNGAFSELIAQRCKPAAVEGVDPSEGQLAFARTRPGAPMAQFRQGDAMALPFGDKTFDAAVMALVIFFVPQPEKGVAEMVRVVRPGGLVAAYAWDVLGGGFPQEPIMVEMRAMGHKTLGPPRADAARMEALRALWTGAGLEAVETREIVVKRTFADFDDLWDTCLLGASVGPTVKAMSEADRATLRERLRVSQPADASGRITCEGRANAVKGRVPK